MEDLELTPSLTFDWEIREGTTDRTQDAFIKLGSVSFAEPISEDEAVDRSLTSKPWAPGRALRAAKLSGHAPRPG